MIDEAPIKWTAKISIGNASPVCCDSGGSHDIGHGTGTGWGIHLDLKKHLAPAVEQCGARGVELSIVVETTREEIVDVYVSTVDDKRPPITVRASGK
jgi:hypothetical protein